MENGPGGTALRCTSALFMKTSTVDGRTADPAACKTGERMNPGWVLKLVPYCAPPIRTARPHVPGRVIVSPRRTLTSSAG